MSLQKLYNALCQRLFMVFNGLFSLGRNRIVGIGFIKRLNSVIITGEGNILECYGKIGRDVRIRVYGNNHHLLIEKDVLIKSGCIWFEDENCEILIGKGTTIEEAHLGVAEFGTKIIIGEDCMLSGGIRITTTDAHSIIDLASGERTNHAADVILNNHIWLGQRVLVNKGVVIGSNVVVASNSVVTKDIPVNSIASGIPARVIRNNVSWERERL